MEENQSQEAQISVSSPGSPAKVSQPHRQTPKFAFILIMILIIVAVSSIGFMYLGNSENNHNITPTTPTPVSSEIKIPVGNQIENWKTYRNDEYGFEFQYPGDWFHEKLEYSSSHINSIFTDHYGFGFIDNKNHIGEEITPFINSRVLIHTANTNNSNIVDDITKNDFNKFTSMNPDISKRQIGNLTFTVVEHAGGLSGGYDVLVHKGNSLIQIEAGLAVYGSDEEVLEAILSTFKFTDDI